MPSPSPQPQPLPPGLREKDIIALNLQELPAAERRRVVRPHDDDPQVETPEHMWIIPSAQNSAYLPFAAYLPSAGSDLMIRQEYYNLLAAVLWSLYRQSQVAQLKRDFPSASEATQEGYMDVDGGAVEEKVSHGVKPDHLRIPNDPPNIFEETTFPNPFKHTRYGHFYRRGSALIITGLPGIGKTLFLSSIFYLRVAAELPTAYMRSEDLMLVYTGERLFVLQTPALVHLALPKDAWILLDSNVNFLSPPQEVAECNHFIVQAASPRAGRTAWASKIRGPHQFCLMRPWTLDELFAGSSLQPQVCSGSDMRTFFNKFGGSARHVYQDSHDLPAFEALVDASARPLDNKAIHRFMTRTSPTVAVDDLVGHMLIAALPLDNETSYLEGKLLTQLNANVLMARRELYVINLGVSSPGCKATAGDLLDKHHHGFIALGGKWRLREFAKDSDWVLEANGKMSVFREPVAGRSRRQKRVAPEFTGLTTLNFPSSDVARLAKDYYYRPSETHFPTFDSFYMDKTGHGFTFQVSDGDTTSHTVKDGGREWLKERAITKFTYILVSAPKMGDPPSISVPRDHETKFDRFFHLVLEYPELKRLLLS
ncbi:hypothetical protein DFH09DRAFT_1495827 [Mycena vulgaris]|nr:hypothetical protein DFH09DRAFT_1495827 [Mycena vulgaris]